MVVPWVPEEGANYLPWLCHWAAWWSRTNLVSQLLFLDLPLSQGSWWGLSSFRGRVLVNNSTVSPVSPFNLEFGQEGKRVVWADASLFFHPMGLHSPGNLEHVWGLLAPNHSSSIRIGRVVWSGSSPLVCCPCSPYIFINQLLNLFITWNRFSCGHHKSAFLRAQLLTNKIFRPYFRHVAHYPIFERNFFRSFFVI